VDGLPSNVVSFDFDAPVITNVAPDRQNVTGSDLRVWLDGTSFCVGGAASCGTLLVNGEAYPAQLWSHTQIMFVYSPRVAGENVTVQVVAGGQASNVRFFLQPVPNVNALVTQDSWTDMDTAGGQLLLIRGVHDVGT